MQMSRMTPYVQALRKKYENDPQKQNEAIQALYKEEGVSGGCGCLWSFIPLLILIPLYTIVREPITYILGESKEVTNQIIEAIKAAQSTDGTAIRDALKDVEMTGVTGDLSFNEIGDANKNMAYIKTIDVATGTFKFLKTQTVAE